jgi:hypothetical protein
MTPAASRGLPTSVWIGCFVASDDVVPRVPTEHDEEIRRTFAESADKIATTHASVANLRDDKIALLVTEQIKEAVTLI